MDIWQKIISYYYWSPNTGLLRIIEHFVYLRSVLWHIFSFLHLSNPVLFPVWVSHEFDSEHVPDLTKEPYVQDIHSVGSLCKLYFRELPNPLLTYQLYEKFSVSMDWGTSSHILWIVLLYGHLKCILA